MITCEKPSQVELTVRRPGVYKVTCGRGSCSMVRVRVKVRVGVLVTGEDDLVTELQRQFLWFAGRRVLDD